MQKKLVLLLAVLAICAVVVRADDDGEASGGASGGQEEVVKPAKPAKATKPAKGKAGGKAPVKAKAEKPLPTVDIPLDAISKLPVGPLSMDAAALKEDDTLFDQFPKQLTGEENVEHLTASLKKAAVLLAKMKRDVEGEKVWTKNVYDIVQNYQYKYLKTVQDVKLREKKIAQMERLVKLLKQSTLHSAVEKELNKASKVLSELVNRSGAGAQSQVYAKVTQRMAKLKNALKTMPRPRELYADTTSKMQDILRSDLPPQTNDAIRELTGDAAAVVPKAKVSAAPKPKAAAPKKAKAAAPKPKAAAKKPTVKKAVTAKKPKAKPAKKVAKKPKAKPAAKKPKAKPAKKASDDDDE